MTVSDSDNMNFNEKNTFSLNKITWTDDLKTLTVDIENIETPINIKNGATYNKAGIINKLVTIFASHTRKVSMNIKTSDNQLNLLVTDKKDSLKTGLITYT
jgi:hypothetical protein